METFKSNRISGYVYSRYVAAPIACMSPMFCSPQTMFSVQIQYSSIFLCSYRLNALNAFTI